MSFLSSRRRSALSKKDAALAYKDAELAAQLVEKDAELSLQLADKDAELAAQLAGKDATIAEKDAVIVEKDAQLAEKDATIAEKDATIAKKDAQLAKKDALIARLLHEQGLEQASDSELSEADELSVTKEYGANLDEESDEEELSATEEVYDKPSSQEPGEEELSATKEVYDAPKSQKASSDEEELSATKVYDDPSLIQDVPDHDPSLSDSEMASSGGMTVVIEDFSTQNVYDAPKRVRNVSDSSDDSSIETYYLDSKAVYDKAGTSNGADGDSDSEDEAADYACVDDLDLDDEEETELSPSSSGPGSSIASCIYDELYPSKPLTAKKQIAGSFPSVEDFSAPITPLSEGNFGRTFRSVYKGVEVVLKVSKVKSERANASDYHEWSITERLTPHPNVLQIIGLCPSFTHPDYKNMGTTSLVMPFQDNGDLKTFIKRACDMTDERQVVNIAFGMIRGVRSLHDQKAIHRDIAVRNYLVDRDGKVVLCDFGLSKFLPDGKTSLESLGEKEELPWRWLAPESCDGKFSKESDIWMYGMALIEVVTKKFPWCFLKSFKDLKAAFRQQCTECKFIRESFGKFCPECGTPLPLVPADLSRHDLTGAPDVIKKLIEDCCQLKPEARPTARDITERLAKWHFKEQDETRWADIRRTRLHDATYDDDLPRVRELLDSTKQSVNARDVFGRVPLCLAESRDVMEALIHHCPIPTSNDEASEATEYKQNADITQFLFDAVHNFHGIDPDGRPVDYTDMYTVDSLVKLSMLLDPRAVDPHRRHGDNQTPIHFAAASEALTTKLDILLCFAVFDIDARDAFGRSALHVAAENGNVGAIRQLTTGTSTSLWCNDAGQLFFYKPEDERKDIDPSGWAKRQSCNVNAKDDTGKTALHHAVLQGHSSAVTALLALPDINVNGRDKTFRTPLFYALGLDDKHKHSFDKQRVEVIASLLEHESIEVNHSTGKRKLASNHPNYLLAAIDCELPLAVKLLLQKGDTDVRTGCPLHKAVKLLKGEITELLLERADVDLTAVNEFGRTPLHEAVYCDRVEPTKLLLRHKDINIDALDDDGYIPLLAAINGETSLNTSSTADLLINHEGTYLKRFGSHILQHAAITDNIELAKTLLAQENIDVNNSYHFDEGTPLHAASSAEMVSTLLTHPDIQVNKRDKDGLTPLHRAAKDAARGPGKIAALLSREEIDVNAQEENGVTPLHQVLFTTNDDFIFKQKCEDGFYEESDTYVAEKASEIPTMDVYELSVRKLLAHRSIDLSLEHNNGETPLDVAKNFGFDNIVSILNEHLENSSNS